jgi:hypothetical protein
MRKLSVLLVLIVVGIVAYNFAYPSVSVFYRMTTVAELNGKQSSGSSVMEVTYYKNVQMLGVEGDIQIGIRGEATSIEFGDKRLLVVLLARGEHPRSGPESIVPFAYGLTKGGIGPEYFPRIAKLSGRKELPPGLFPAAVFFRDSRDPTSVELVNPPAATGGSAIVPRLVSVTLEVLDTETWMSGWPFTYIFIAGRPAHSSINQTLPWLKNDSSRKQFARTLRAKNYPASSSAETYSLFTMPH